MLINKILHFLLSAQNSPTNPIFPCSLFYFFYHSSNNWILKQIFPKLLFLWLGKLWLLSSKSGVLSGGICSLGSCGRGLKIHLLHNSIMGQIKTHKDRKTRKAKAKMCPFAGVSQIIFTKITTFKLVLNLLREFQLQTMKILKQSRNTTQIIGYCKSSRGRPTVCGHLFAASATKWYKKPCIFVLVYAFHKWKELQDWKFQH